MTCTTIVTTTAARVRQDRSPVLSLSKTLAGRHAVDVEPTKENTRETGSEPGNTHGLLPVNGTLMVTKAPPEPIGTNDSNDAADSSPGAFSFSARSRSHPGRRGLIDVHQRIPGS
jgi:hypothetical protein